MGNRALVVFHDNEGHFSPGIYLHWNGGIESIHGFLKEMDRRNIRGSDDLDYCAARFCHIVADFFDQDSAGSTSIGITNVKDLEDIKKSSPGDNGVFMIYRESSSRGSKTVITRPDGTKVKLDKESKELCAKYEESMAKTFIKLRPNVKD